MSLIWLPAQLATLSKVVELNGFSAAARALDVPKAAVSRAIADLEAFLGVKVLTRTTRRLSLTEAGQLIYPHARRLADEADAARTQIGRWFAPPTGPLRVVADPTYGRILLAPLVPRFMESFPDIPLEVNLQPQTPGMDPASGKGSDVAIRTASGEEAGMTQRLLGAPPAILCATPAYLQRRGTPERPDDLRAHDLLTPEGEGPEFRMTLVHGAMRAEIRVTSRLAVNDPAVLHAATAAGLGIGVLPEFLCRQGLATGRLKLLLPDWELPQIMPLYAVYPATQGADTRVQRFVDFLAANVVPALAQI
jgi:LysR family transcriptional regulator, regulator for bpeEF and oprC